MVLQDFLLTDPDKVVSYALFYCTQAGQQQQ